jgi:hypothetical protein
MSYSENEIMNRFIFGVLVIAACFKAHAQGSDSGNANKITDDEHGYSFRAPDGWRAEKRNGQCAGFKLLDATNEMAMVVKPHHSNSLADFIAHESGWPFQKIKYGSKITDIGQGMQYVRTYLGGKGTDFFMDTIFIPVKDKRGVVIVNLTKNQDAAEKAMKYADAAIRSVEYFVPTLAHLVQPALPAQAASASSSYDRIFAGKKFYFENPRSGTQFVLHFCSSGNYTEIYQGTYSSGTAGDETRGRWGVHESAGKIYLTKNSRDEQKMFPVTQGSRNGSIKLGGMEYAVTESRECR